MNQQHSHIHHCGRRRRARIALKRAALAAGAAMLVAPAAAGAYPASEPTQLTAATNQAQRDSSPGFVQRRDGSKAVPFVADVSPTAPALPHGAEYSSTEVNTPSAPSRTAIASVASNPGFDWGDAGIGAGVAAGAIALAMTGVLGARRLKSAPRGARMPAATSS